MTVEQSEAIDAMGVDRATGASVLWISDHLVWDDSHLDLLERKFARYVNFIEGGQLAEYHPDPKQPTIHLFLLHRPSTLGLEFLFTARQTLAVRGIEFRFGALLADGYSDDN